MRRCEAYREAGADLLFVDGIRTLDDLQQYSSRLSHLPLLYNGDLLPITELAGYRFKLTIHIGTLLAAYANFRDALRQLKGTGRLNVSFTPELFEELTDLMGVPEADTRSKRYQA